MRNGGEIAVLFHFARFGANVLVLAIGGHEQGGPSHSAEKHNEDRVTFKWA
jgi:hypothetical protein